MTGTVEYGVSYEDPERFVSGGFTLAGARRLVAEARARAGAGRDGRFSPCPCRVVRREIGPWTTHPEDQPTEGATK